MGLAGAARAASFLVLPGPFADAQELASRLFLAADPDRDGVLTRAELEATFEGWSAVTRERLPEALEDALPPLPQNTTPQPPTIHPMLPHFPHPPPPTPPHH